MKKRRLVHKLGVIYETSPSLMKMIPKIIEKIIEEVKKKEKTPNKGGAQKEETSSYEKKA